MARCGESKSHALTLPQCRQCLILLIDECRPEDPENLEPEQAKCLTAFQRKVESKINVRRSPRPLLVSRLLSAVDPPSTALLDGGSQPRSGWRLSTAALPACFPVRPHPAHRNGMKRWSTSPNTPCRHRRWSVSCVGCRKQVQCRRGSGTVPAVSSMASTGESGCHPRRNRAK